MKMIFQAACMLLLASAAPPLRAAEKDELRIRVALTSGERSKDSSSKTTTITVSAGTVAVEQTATGSHRGKAEAAERKQFGLDASDREKLLALIKANELLVTDSVTLPERAPVFYFRLSIETQAEGRRGVIHISGPRSVPELRDKRLYQRSVALVKELYKIIHRQDKTVVFEEPLQQRP